MLEDMTLRKLAPKTQSHYLRAVINFTCFLGRSPDTASQEDLRRYQLHLVETGTSSIIAEQNDHGITVLLRRDTGSRGGNGQDEFGA